MRIGEWKRRKNKVYGVGVMRQTMSKYRIYETGDERTVKGR